MEEALKELVVDVGEQKPKGEDSILVRRDAIIDRYPYPYDFI